MHGLCLRTQSADASFQSRALALTHASLSISPVMFLCSDRCCFSRIYFYRVLARASLYASLTAPLACLRFLSVFLCKGTHLQIQSMAKDANIYVLCPAFVPTLPAT